MNDTMDQSKPGEIPESNFLPKNLIDYKYVIEEFQTNVSVEPKPFGGVVLRYGVRVDCNTDRVVDDERGKQEMLILAERLRDQAIYDLGIRPLIDSWEKDIRELTRQRDEAVAGIAWRDKKIVEQQRTIDILRGSYFNDG